MSNLLRMTGWKAHFATSSSSSSVQYDDHLNTNRFKLLAPVKNVKGHLIQQISMHFLLPSAELEVVPALAILSHLSTGTF